MLHALRRLGDRGRVERVADHDLGATHLEGGRLHGVADQHPELMPAVEDLVSHAATDEPGRAEEEDSCHRATC